VRGKLAPSAHELARILDMDGQGWGHIDDLPALKARLGLTGG
jgi:hypothetical protein